VASAPVSSASSTARIAEVSRNAAEVTVEINSSGDAERARSHIARRSAVEAVFLEVEKSIQAGGPPGYLPAPGSIADFRPPRPKKVSASDVVAARR